jgi:hypothetical protein
MPSQRPEAEKTQILFMKLRQKPLMAISFTGKFPSRDPTHSMHLTKRILTPPAEGHYLAI